MNLRDFIIRWNNENPLDKKFREKHNLGFNSPQHRAVNQLDVLLEFIEEEIFSEYKTTVEQQIEKEKQYEKGEWLQEVLLSSKESQDLFDKIDIFQINKTDSQLKIEE